MGRIFFLSVLVCSVTLAGKPHCVTQLYDVSQDGRVYAAAPADRVEKIRKLIAKETTYFSPRQVATLSKHAGLSPVELLVPLAAIAKQFARPPISNYLVGVAGLAASGAIHLGVNIEFPGHPLFQTVHGEQFLVAQLLLQNETGLQFLSLSGEPCGHCRQFMTELVGSKDIRILIPGSPVVRLEALLPKPFGPAALGSSIELLTHPRRRLAVVSDQDARRTPRGPEGRVLAHLEGDALEAARRAYCPYTNEPVGVAIRAHGSVETFIGMNIESVAYNPSLPAFQVALTQLVAKRVDFASITDVILLEKGDAKKSEAENTRAMLRLMAPRARFILKHITEGINR